MRKKNNSKVNLPLCICVGILIAVFSKIFVLDFYRVKGFSMEPAIMDGQTIAACKFFYGLQNPFRPELLFCWNEPKAGETILYMYQDYWVVKRCAAVAGSPLECAEEGGKYFLLAAGKKIPLTSIQFHKLRTNKMVPQGYVMAIGDNAELSHDSRDYGFVPVKNVVARVIPPRRAIAKSR